MTVSLPQLPWHKIRQFPAGTKVPDIWATIFSFLQAWAALSLTLVSTWRGLEGSGYNMKIKDAHTHTERNARIHLAVLRVKDCYSKSSQHDP